MSFSFRQVEILEIAQLNGKVEVEPLAEHFSVSVQTIRRDLTELAEAGKLDRVHGGAIVPSGVANLHYDQRRIKNEEGKARVAKACAQRIPNNASVFLNIGTSTEAVARELIHHENLLVMTNNINVANILRDNPSCEIILTGGSLRRSDGGLIGPLTTTVIEQFKFDFAIIGCSGIDEDGDLLDFDIQEVGVSQSIIKQSRRVLLVTDHTKFGRNAPARIASLANVETCFTDQKIPTALEKKCREWGTEVSVAR